jgi:DNA polymerase III gamma/tau subunit
MSKQARKREPVIYRDFITDFAPRRFADIVGQQDEIHEISQWILQSAIPKAILFSGSVGVGKTILANLLSKSAACTGRRKNEFEPCGECRVCKNYPLINCYSEIASRITNCDKFREDVDNARSGYNPMLYEDHRGEWYPMLIDELDELKEQSQMDLRRQLEVPWKKAFIVATSAHPDDIDQMLRDRLTEIALQPPSKKELHNYILGICSKVGIDIAEPDSSAVIVDLTHGRFRKMLKLLERIRSSACPKLEEANIRRAFSRMPVIEDKKR